MSLLPVNDFDWIRLPFVTHTLVAANPIQYIYMSGMLYSVSICLFIYLSICLFIYTVSLFICVFVYVSFSVDKLGLISIIHQPFVFFVHAIYILTAIT